MKPLIIFLLTLALFCSGAYAWLSTPVYVQRPPNSAGVASQLIKGAMAYHGIGYAPYDRLRGSYGFMRDGQWCQLFSAGFLDTQNFNEWR